MNPTNNPINTLSPPPTGPVAPAQSKFFSRKVITIAAGLVILAGAALAIIIMQSAAGPDSVFRKALNNSFSTNSLTQKETETESGIMSDITIKYDLHDLSNMIVSSSNHLSLGSASDNIDSYGNSRSSYVKETLADSELAALGPGKQVNGKWIQVRKDGKTPANAASSGLPIIDAREMFFGNLIFGNFSSKDRQTLVDYLLNNKVYSYDSSKVASKNIGGVSTDVYDVRIDTAKLVEFNKMVAKIVNIPVSDIPQDVFDGIKNIPKATFYIDKQQKNLIRVDVDVNGIKATVNYSEYNTTTLPAEPKANLSFEDYLKLVSQ